MSLGDPLGSGSSSVIPILTEAGPGIPFFAPASGGGGGGGGPVLTVSTINMNAFGEQNMRFNPANADPTGFNGAVLAFDQDATPNTTTLFGYCDNISSMRLSGYSNGNLLPVSLKVDNLTVSTINGAAPGSGFTSSFSVPVAAQASTLLLEVPAGQWAYQGQMIYSGSLTTTAGYVNVLVNQSGPVYYGSLVAVDSNAMTTPNTNPNGFVSLDGENNPLSTIKLYAVNQAAGSAANWIGVIGKLY